MSNDLKRYLRRKVMDALNTGHDRTSRSCPHLFAAIRKYGPQNFVVHPLISTLQTEAELLHWERELIALLKAQDPAIGYNITPGGDGGWTGSANPFFGKHHTEKSRKAIKEKRALQTFSLEERQARREWALATGCKPPDHTGKKWPLDRKTGNNPGMKGQHHTEETKARMRRARAAFLRNKPSSKGWAFSPYRSGHSVRFTQP